MTLTISKILMRLKSDERGVTLVEYGIAISLALLVGVVALTTLGGEIGAAIGAASAEMPD